MSSVTHPLQHFSRTDQHDGKISVAGRNITNPGFADDIDALVEKELELEVLVKCLDKTCTRYKM